MHIHSFIHQLRSCILAYEKRRRRPRGSRNSGGIPLVLSNKRLHRLQKDNKTVAAAAAVIWVLRHVMMLLLLGSTHRAKDIERKVHSTAPQPCTPVTFSLTTLRRCQASETANNDIVVRPISHSCHVLCCRSHDARTINQSNKYQCGQQGPYLSRIKTKDRSW